MCFLFNKCFCYFSCLLLTWSNFNFKTPLPEPHVDFRMFNFNLIPKLPIIISYLQSILSHHKIFHFSIPVLSSGFKIQFPFSWSASFSSPFDEGMLAATLWISENTLILNDSSSADWIHVFVSAPKILFHYLLASITDEKKSEISLILIHYFLW